MMRVLNSSTNNLNTFFYGMHTALPPQDMEMKMKVVGDGDVD